MSRREPIAQTKTFSALPNDSRCPELRSRECRAANSFAMKTTDNSRSGSSQSSGARFRSLPLWLVSAGVVLMVALIIVGIWMGYAALALALHYLTPVWLVLCVPGAVIAFARRRKIEAHTIPEDGAIVVSYLTLAIVLPGWALRVVEFFVRATMR